MSGTIFPFVVRATQKSFVINSLSIDIIFCICYLLSWWYRIIKSKLNDDYFDFYFVITYSCTTNTTKFNFNSTMISEHMSRSAKLKEHDNMKIDVVLEKISRKSPYSSRKPLPRRRSEITLRGNGWRFSPRSNINNRQEKPSPSQRSFHDSDKSVRPSSATFCNLYLSVARPRRICERKHQGEKRKQKARNRAERRLFAGERCGCARNMNYSWRRAVQKPRGSCFPRFITRYQ